MRIDWSKATADDRKRLYRLAQSIVRNEGISWQELYDEAFGTRFRRGSGYEANFSSGRISRNVAARVYAWIRQAYPDRADAFEHEAATRSESSYAIWEKFIDDHELTGRIKARLVPKPRQRGETSGRAKIDRYEPEEEAELTIRGGTPFFLEVESPFDGLALGFHGARKRWHLLPLGVSTASARVQEGARRLPPWSEETPTLNLLASTQLDGVNRIIVALVAADLSHAIILPDERGDIVSANFLSGLAQILESSPQEQWSILRLNVLFT